MYRNCRSQNLPPAVLRIVFLHTPPNINIINMTAEKPLDTLQRIVDAGPAVLLARVQTVRSLAPKALQTWSPPRACALIRCIGDALVLAWPSVAVNLRAQRRYKDALCGLAHVVREELCFLSTPPIIWMHLPDRPGTPTAADNMEAICAYVEEGLAASADKGLPIDMWLAPDFLHWLDTPVLWLMSWDEHWHDMRQHQGKEDRRDSGDTRGSSSGRDRDRDRDKDRDRAMASKDQHAKVRAAVAQLLERSVAVWGDCRRVWVRVLSQFFTSFMPPHSYAAADALGHAMLQYPALASADFVSLLGYFATLYAFSTRADRARAWVAQHVASPAALEYVRAGAWSRRVDAAAAWRRARRKT